MLAELAPSGPAADAAARIQHVADRPGHDARYALDDSATRAQLGWRPSVNLESGLHATAAWYLRHEDWISRALRRARYNRQRLGLR